LSLILLASGLNKLSPQSPVSITSFAIGAKWLRIFRIPFLPEQPGRSHLGTT
jgi:hypothetical protein